MATAITKEQPSVGAPRASTVFRVTAFVATVCFLILVFTGIVPLMMGRHVGGIALLAHVGVGGLFAFCLALLAIGGSARYAFDLPATRNEATVGRKILFWLFIAGGLSLIISAVLMMMPLYGTSGQAGLVAWHRRTSYIEMVVAAFLAISMLLGRGRA